MSITLEQLENYRRGKLPSGKPYLVQVDSDTMPDYPGAAARYFGIEPHEFMAGNDFSIPALRGKHVEYPRPGEGLKDYAKLHVIGEKYITEADNISMDRDFTAADFGIMAAMALGPWAVGAVTGATALETAGMGGGIVTAESIAVSAPLATVAPVVGTPIASAVAGGSALTAAGLIKSVTTVAGAVGAIGAAVGGAARASVSRPSAPNTAEVVGTDRIAGIPVAYLLGGAALIFLMVKR